MEEGRIVDALVGEVDEVQQARDGRVGDDVVVAQRCELRPCRARVSRDFLIVHIDLGDRGEGLAVDGGNGFELELAAVGEGDGDKPPANRIEAVLRDYGIGDGFCPLLAEIGGLFQTNVLDAERPADTEVALPLVSRVVGADDLNRQSC